MNQTMNKTDIKCSFLKYLFHVLLDAACTFCLADTYMSMLCHIRLVKATNSLIFPLQFFITYHELSHPKLLRYVCVQNCLVYFLILYLTVH